MPLKKFKRLDWRNARSLVGKTIAKVKTEPKLANGREKVTDVVCITFTDGSFWSLDVDEGHEGAFYIVNGWVGEHE